MKYVHTVDFHILLGDVKSGTSGHLKAIWEQFCINDKCSLKYLCHIILSWQDVIQSPYLWNCPYRRKQEGLLLQGFTFLMIDLSHLKEKKNCVPSLKDEIIVVLGGLRHAEKPRVLKMLWDYIVTFLWNCREAINFSFKIPVFWNNTYTACVTPFLVGFWGCGFFPPEKLLLLTSYGDMKHLDIVI